MAKKSRKLIANNKKARHDYFVEDSLEAGIVLTGTEIKSIRAGRCSIKESYVYIDKKGEMKICGMHISQVQGAGTQQPVPAVLHHAPPLNRATASTWNPFGSESCFSTAEKSTKSRERSRSPVSPSFR